jgi:hypothetical protein
MRRLQSREASSHIAIRIQPVSSEKRACVQLSFAEHCTHHGYADSGLQTERPLILRIDGRFNAKSGMCLEMLPANRWNFPEAAYLAAKSHAARNIAVANVRLCPLWRRVKQHTTPLVFPRLLAYSQRSNGKKRSHQLEAVQYQRHSGSRCASTAPSPGKQKIRSLGVEALLAVQPSSTVQVSSVLH